MNELILGDDRSADALTTTTTPATANDPAPRRPPNRNATPTPHQRSSNVGEQPSLLANAGLPAAFAQYARPLQTSPQDIYYFTKRSFPSIVSGLNGAGVMHAVQDVLERVARAIDNADKRYN